MTMFVLVILATALVLYAMLKVGKKKKVMLAVACLLLIFAHQFPFIQQATARMTAGVHVWVQHFGVDLNYQSIEYSVTFGAYFVRYIDKDGEPVSFQIESKKIPLVVTHDPLVSKP